ncbi:MAG: glycosyltransferase [Candidatus Margulisbacteria bacterium]|jgi:GT2 family glycosyltransferase|nr:glycosyltransferase [Candidatus Margulisiibacteriota bacterium]
MPVDVIIPVFNNYELTKNCLNSVMRHTAPENRLIIVDDNSSDRAVLALEREFAGREANITVINKKKNEGFLPAANLGMRQSANDVILLNNDTIVTPGWLAKMQVAAYRAENIASVSAMSNNSTITSMPKYFRPNAVPGFFTLDEMAAFVEKNSLRLYPELPTAMGFCLYIRRAALNEVGYYDEIYGRGYGEENDWSLRARAKGWKHLMDDTTYIWHQGRGTAGAQKRRELLARNEKILFSRYPGYPQEIKNYIVRKVNYAVNKNLQKALRGHRLDLFRKKLSSLF